MPDSISVQALRVSELALLVSALQLAVAFTVGVGAVLVAWLQVNRFIEAERNKATLAYIAAYDQIPRQIPMNEPLTVAMAMRFTLAATDSQDNLTFYRDTAKVYFSINPARRLTDEEIIHFMKLNGCFINCTNYFITAANLIRYKHLDGTLFVDFFGSQVLDTWRLVTALADLEPFAKNASTNPSLLNLIKLVETNSPN